MSSSDFEKVLIRDERLDCHDAIPFAVYRSGSNVTVATFNAISESASSMVFNVQVPSETTVIDRRIIWESTLDFDVTFKSSASASGNKVPCCEYGLKQAFCNWPLHSLCNTQQATINNNSVTLNTADILPALARFHDMRELQRYNGMSPTKPDNFQNYSDALGSINNVLSSALNVAMENDYAPRGALDVAVSWLTSGNIAISDNEQAIPSGSGVTCTYHVRATLREPLLMSPFLYAHPFYNGQGFYGLQNLNFVFNLNAASAGLWRCMDNSAYAPNTLYDVSQPQFLPTITNFVPTNSRLIFNFLTPKPSDLLAARNVVPYWEMPRYLRSAAVPATTVGYVPSQAGTKPTAITYTPIQSQSLQLNQVPDKLIVFFRPQQQDRTAFMSDRSLIINRIAINWNNQSGILASATQDQLWRYSVESGSIQSWEEFSGVYNIGKPGLALPSGSGPAAGGNIFSQLVPTVGSYLMLDFAKHINITEDYYAPGSLGNFNLQFTVDVGSNNRQISGAMDMVIITVNSGLFVTEKGQSATYTGILTKDDVLSAAAMKPVSDAEARRLVGGLNIGALLNTAGKVGRTISKYAPVADAALGLLPEGKLKSGLQTGLSFAKKGADIAGKFGSEGSGMRGRGRGSQVFNIQDRLV